MWLKALVRRWHPLHLPLTEGATQPIISGSGHNDGGGDYKEAIVINNKDHMVFEDLEIQNHRTQSRTGVDDIVSFGILIQNTLTK